MILTTLLVGISPLVVPLITRPRWPGALKVIVAMLTLCLLFTLGWFLDYGLIDWPLTLDFKLKLAAAFGAQQALYQALLRNTKIMAALEVMHF